MPGRRLKSYRSGDINEDLGIFLLKSFSLVAPVPRQEDVGLDAVATLLRSDGKLLIAEDSFCVQFKSDTERIIYKQHGVAWLKTLRLPFFIGCVDRKKLQIELFATHALSVILIEHDYQEIVLHLRPDSEELPGDHVRNVGLGEPLLRWSANDLNDEGFAELAYKIMKVYLPAEQFNLRHRDIRVLRAIHWLTNFEPKPSSGHTMFAQVGDREELIKLATSLEPALTKLLLAYMNVEDWSGFDSVRSFGRFMIERTGHTFGSFALLEELGEARRYGRYTQTFDVPGPEPPEPA
jgi:hypothetical protein